MGVRNCAEIGENLQKIMARLLANDDLVKLLYYADADPIGHQNLTNEQKKQYITNKLIRVIPKVTEKDTAQSLLAIVVDNGTKLSQNNEYHNISITINVFVPLTAWFIKDTNLRPFAILGEIQKSLDGKTVNGLGKLNGGDFELDFLTEEVSCYKTTYFITNYA